MKYVWPPIITAIEKRQKEISDGLTFAECAKKDLDLAQINATNELNKAKIQAQVIIEQANKCKAQILEKAKTEAKKERNKILMQAQVDIEVTRKRAYEELRKQIAILAIAGAEKIIECSVDVTTSNDIINKMIAEL